MKTNLRNILFILHSTWAMCLVDFASGQDIHFSQSFHSPILLNPAQTGEYFGDWRFVHNFRQQWSQLGKPLNTIGLGYDRQFYVMRQKLSSGIQIVHDESGDFRLVHQKMLLSFAYHHTISRNEFHFGIQGGYVLKRLDATGATLPDQYDVSIGGFNSSFSTQEVIFNNREEYADINVGIAYSRKFSKWKPTIGIALYHINQPNESFTSNINYLAVREVIHASSMVFINDRYTIEPQIIYMSQRKSKDLLFGSLGYMKLAKNPLKAQQAFAGVHIRDGITRNWDALIVSTGLQFKQLRTAVSYDVTVSRLRMANSYRGAFEISVIYTGLSSILQTRTIPCQRL